MATVTITGGTGDAGALGDDRPWLMWAAAYQPDGQGGVITTRDDRASNVLRPVAGVLTFKVEAGITCYLETPDKRVYLIAAPEEDTPLWDVIEASVAYPPDTDQQLLADAVDQFVLENADIIAFDDVQASVDGLSAEFLRNGDVIGSAELPSAAVGSVVGLPGRLAAWAGADAYINFATKANGNPPAILDTGQSVDFITETQNGWKPQIASGKLVHGTLPVSGPYAAYYQAQLDGDCYKAGARWTVLGDGSAGTTNGIMCLAIWDGIYHPTTMDVPRHLVHLTCTTLPSGGLVTYQFWVSDGDDTHFMACKTWQCVAPASDGVAIWETAVQVDLDNGVVWLKLPGDDSVTGSRIVTVTEAEVQAALTSNGKPSKTFEELFTGSDVLVLEHYGTDGETAIYPRFIDVWGEVARPARKASAELTAIASDPAVAAAPRYARYLPTPAEYVELDPLDGFVDVPGEFGSLEVTFTVPPGYTAAKVTANLYYNIALATKIVVAFTEGATMYGVHAVIESASHIGNVPYIAYREDLVPGSTYTFTLQHLTTATGTTLYLDYANGYAATMEVSFVKGSG